jgi:hypothetical protein
MATDRHDLTPAGIWELCATSQGLVDDMHLAIESSRTLRGRAADLHRQSRQAREARTAATARTHPGHERADTPSPASPGGSLL